jgi:hypothetical protein
VYDALYSSAQEKASKPEAAKLRLKKANLP